MQVIGVSSIATLKSFHIRPNHMTESHSPKGLRSSSVTKARFKQQKQKKLASYTEKSIWLSTRHSSVEMEGCSENLMVRLPRMAKIAERSRENDKVQHIQDSI